MHLGARAAPPAADGPARYRPRWYRFAWFLGRPPALTRRQWHVLGLVSLVSLFEQYDLYLFALNLPMIQRDLGIDEAQLGLLGGLVWMGALPAVVVTLAADRFGRRRLLLGTVLAYTLLTGATAVSASATQFVVLQSFARTFATAETVLAVVVIAEEFGPGHRGWAVGALGAITACGAGLAALLFGFVHLLPFGWRALYLVGLAPLLCVAWWRRAMPETECFVALERARARTPGAASVLWPLLALVRAYPARFAALGGAAFLVELAIRPAMFFAPKYLQDVHGWAPGWVAALNFGGGALGIVGNPVAGWLSDRCGRKPVTALFAAGLGVSIMAFYGTPGFMLGPLWVVLIFTGMGSNVTLSACSAEMFPTSSRSTAAGVRSAATTLGGVSGLGLVWILYGVVGSNWIAIALLGGAAFFAPLLVLLFFPETSGRRLEDIAPEPDGAAQDAVSG